MTALPKQNKQEHVVNSVFLCRSNRIYLFPLHGFFLFLVGEFNSAQHSCTVLTVFSDHPLYIYCKTKSRRRNSWVSLFQRAHRSICPIGYQQETNNSYQRASQWPRRLKLKTFLFLFSLYFLYNLSCRGFICLSVDSRRDKKNVILLKMWTKVLISCKSSELSLLRGITHILHRVIHLIIGLNCCLVCLFALFNQQRVKNSSC